MNKVFESPDSINKSLRYDKYGDPPFFYETIESEESDLIAIYEDSDAHPFWIGHTDDIIFGDAGETHPMGVVRNHTYYPGRLWKDKKLISFWVYPSANLFKKIISELSKKLNIYYKVWECNTPGYINY